MRLLKTALLSTTLMMFSTVSAATAEMADPTAAVPSTNAAVARLQEANTEFKKTVIESLLDAIKAQTSSNSLDKTAKEAITKLLEGKSYPTTKVSDVIVVLAGTFKVFRKSLKKETEVSAKTLEGLNTELSTLTAELEALEASQIDVERDVNTYPAKMDETQKEIEVKERAVGASRAEFEKASEAKRQLVEAAKTTLATESGNLEALKKRIDSLQAQIGHLEKDEVLDPDSLALLDAARNGVSPARTMDTDLFGSVNASPFASSPRADEGNSALTSSNLGNVPSATPTDLVAEFNADSSEAVAGDATEEGLATTAADEPEAVTPTEEEIGAAGNSNLTTSEITQQLSNLAAAVEGKELEAREAFSNFEADAHNDAVVVGSNVVEPSTTLDVTGADEVNPTVAATSTVALATEDKPTPAAAEEESNAEAAKAEKIKKLEAELAAAQAATTATPFSGRGSVKRNNDAQAKAKSDVTRLTAEIADLKALTA